MKMCPWQDAELSLFLYFILLRLKHFLSRLTQIVVLVLVLVNYSDHMVGPHGYTATLLRFIIYYFCCKYFSTGCPSVLTNQGCRNPTLAYQGCMRSVIINNQPINFYLVQQGLLGNYSKLQFDICGIRDRYIY